MQTIALQLECIKTASALICVVHLWWVGCQWTMVAFWVVFGGFKYIYFQAEPRTQMSATHCKLQADATPSPYKPTSSASSLQTTGVTMIPSKDTKDHHYSTYKTMAVLRLALPWQATGILLGPRLEFILLRS